MAVDAEVRPAYGNQTLLRMQGRGARSTPLSPSRMASPLLQRQHVEEKHGDDRNIVTIIGDDAETKKDGPPEMGDPDVLDYRWIDWSEYNK